MEATATEHKIRWYVYAVPGDRSTLIPCTARMRGTWSYEARCSCGQETRTGGCTETYLRASIEDHKAGFGSGWYPVETAR